MSEHKDNLPDGHSNYLKISQVSEINTTFDEAALNEGKKLLRQADSSLNRARKLDKDNGNSDVAAFYFERSIYERASALEFLPQLGWKDHLDLMEAQTALAVWDNLLPAKFDADMSPEEIAEMTLITRNALIENAEESFENAVQAAGGVDAATPNILAKIFSMRAKMLAKVASSGNQNVKTKKADLIEALSGIEDAQRLINQIGARKIGRIMLSRDIKKQGQRLRSLAEERSAKKIA